MRWRKGTSVARVRALSVGSVMIMRDPRIFGFLSIRNILPSTTISYACIEQSSFLEALSSASVSSIVVSESARARASWRRITHDTLTRRAVARVRRARE